MTLRNSIVVLVGAVAGAAPGLSAAQSEPQPQPTVVYSWPIGYEPNQDSEVNTFEIEEERDTQFFGGSSLLLKPRSYYLDRDRDQNPDSVGLALGGALEYRSGWWRDRLQVGATLFTSQKLYGPSDKDGTLLFKPGPESFTVIGEANLTYRMGNNTGVRLGRQRFEVPYLGSHDIRMVPNTFEAVAIADISTEGDGLAWILGYVDQIKRKNDDDFISMSEAAGAEGSNEGVFMAGIRYDLPGGWELNAIDHYTNDVFNTLFFKTNKDFSVNKGWTMGVHVQYTDQRDVGDALIGDFSTGLLSTKLELKRESTTLRAAFSTTDNERGIQKPYGNPANYLSVIVEDFDRAGEDAWLIGATYDFGQVGIGELSVFGNIVGGDTPDSGPAASPDQVEYDLTADYRMNSGWTDRLWLRVRAAWVDQDEAVGGNDFLDFRIIVNYDLETLQ
jgi:hypothetical protein